MVLRWRLLWNLPQHSRAGSAATGGERTERRLPVLRAGCVHHPAASVVNYGSHIDSNSIVK
jgi:hypothetical protein